MNSFFPRHLNSILAFSFMMLFLTSCDTDKNQAPAPIPVQPRQTLRIGLFPEQNIFVQKKQYAPIAEYLSRKSGITIELIIIRTYENLVENFLEQNLDGAFFGSLTGAKAIMALGVEPLARPEYANGISSYYGMIFARKNSGIKNGADMRGKVFVFANNASTAGWLHPLHFFHELGIKDYQTWFREIYFSGTYEDAIHDVLNGKADIGSTKSLIFDQLARADSRVMDELQILSVSPKMPTNALALGKSIPLPLQKQLKDLLLTMHENPEGLKALKEFGAVRFVETRREDYQPVLTYAGHVDLFVKNQDGNSR